MIHPFIYINGYPGVGKLTVARELEKLLPKSKIYHNHLLIDPIAPLVDRTSPEYTAIRTNLRRQILDVIATSEATRDTTWIFTDSWCTSEAGRDAAKDYQDAASRRGVPFITVIMTCNPGENARRIVDEGRKGRNYTKLRDVEVLRSIRKQEEIFRFGGHEELVLDVTDLSPKDSAQRIVKHVRRVAEWHEGHGREQRAGEDLDIT